MARGDGESTTKLYGHGFDPDVCEGCPYHEYFREDADGGLIQKLGNMVAGDESGYWGCGICGCPTQAGLLLDQLQAPPEGCVRLDGHRRRSE